MALDLQPFEGSDYLTTPERVQAYLLVTLQDGTPEEVALAFRTVARSAGLAVFAERFDLSAETIRNAFATPGQPDLTVMDHVLSKLGWRLAPVRAA